jgi:hypothetical protein
MMMNPKTILVGFMAIGILLISGCFEEQSETAEHPPEQPASELLKGILINEIPENADIIFDSVRHVLDSQECLDKNYELKNNFINDPGCNRMIYTSEGRLAPLKQLFTMDIETGNVVQITNMDCYFVTGQVINSTTILVNAICSDTDNNGKINDQDKPELYLLDLTTGGMNCLTCEYDLTSINNPDYSPVNGKIVFSAGTGSGMNNRLFTIDFDKNLVQLTNDSEYLDFDCSWSEDATKIVFSRLPNQAYPFSIPSQVWLMDAAGTTMKKITDGGLNPHNEKPHRQYPIGTDADPDLSPDNKKIVISRLRTGQENAAFGVWELVIVDVDTGREEVLDSQYANMIPEWKLEGILFIRQIVGNTNNAMDITQSLYIYSGGVFKELETFPYNVFPVGAYGAHWINLKPAKGDGRIFADIRYGIFMTCSPQQKSMPTYNLLVRHLSLAFVYYLNLCIHIIPFILIAGYPPGV